MLFLDKLNNAVKVLTGIFFLIMTVVVLLQVFFRYVLNNPVAEFQEISVYSMVYLVMLGSTIAVHNKTHIAVDYFVGKLPGAAKKTVTLAMYAVMAGFFLILLKEGYTQCLRSMTQISPSTGIPVGYVMFSMPLCAAISLFYIAGQFIAECGKTDAGHRRDPARRDMDIKE